MEIAITPRKLSLRWEWATFLLGFSMCTTGASGLVNEYVLATISSYILGNTVEQFSIVIALMMFMMGIASYVQKRIGDELLIEKFIAIEIAMALVGGSAPIAIYAAYAFIPDHFSLVNYGYMMGIGFLIGLEIPLVTRINERYSETLKTNLSIVLGMDYVGSFIGALVWTYYLLRNFPLTQISFIVAGLNFLVAIITYGYFFRKKLVSRNSLVLMAIFLTASFIVVGLCQVRGWEYRLEQKLYDEPIIFSATTKYQHLVLSHDPRNDDFRLYINGGTQFSSVDERIYHEQLVHPVLTLVPDHAKVLILGGGDGMALREVLKYADVRKVSLVDIDPEMIRLFRDVPQLAKLNNHSFTDARVFATASAAVHEEGRRSVNLAVAPGSKKKGQPEMVNAAMVSVYTLDADKFIQEDGGSFNVAIIDLPDPRGVELNKLYTREFYTKLKKRMAYKGMIAIQATSPYHAKEAFLCIRRTMEAAGWKTLPYHDNVPSFGDWGFILAWQSDESEAEMRQRISGITSFPVETGYLTPELFRSSLVFGKGLLTDGSVRINTLMEPVLMNLYLDKAWKTE